MKRLALLLLLAGCTDAPHEPRGEAPEIYIAPIVWEWMHGAQEWTNEHDLEHAACLVGDTDRLTFWHVTGLAEARVRERGPRHIRLDPCLGKEHVGWFHTHPPGECMWSGEDVAAMADHRVPAGLVTCGDERRDVALWYAWGHSGFLLDGPP